MHVSYLAFLRLHWTSIHWDTLASHKSLVFAIHGYKLISYLKEFNSSHNATFKSNTIGFLRPLFDCPHLAIYIGYQSDITLIDTLSHEVFLSQDKFDILFSIVECVCYSLLKIRRQFTSKPFDRRDLDNPTVRDYSWYSQVIWKSCLVI